MNVYIVTFRYQDDTEYIEVCDSETTALKFAMQEIANYVEGAWNEYNKEHVKLFKYFTEKKDYYSVLQLWNDDMSSFSVSICKNEVIRESDIELDFSFPEE